MLVAVEAPDTQSAMSLVQRLVPVVGGEAVSLAASVGEVRVEASSESDRVLVDTLDAVEDWVSELELDHARVRYDGRTYTMHAADKGPHRRGEPSQEVSAEIDGSRK
jgi:hypothetical protein